MLEELRRIRNQRPFVPYTIVLTDGRRFHLTDQFHVAFAGGQVSLVEEPSERLVRFPVSFLKEVVMDEEIGERVR